MTLLYHPPLAPEGNVATRAFDKVAIAARGLGASENATKALLALARDPHGIERGSAPSMLASNLHISLQDANDVIIELLAKRMIVEDCQIPPRLVADLARLGLNSEESITLKSRPTIFVNRGAPHSTAAMESLDKFFRETVGPIIVALEITAPSVFREFNARAKSGRRTIFLMPRKKDVSDQRQIHYEEIMTSWVTLFRQSESFVQKNTELRITEVPFKDLYTSALSAELARFDIHYLDAQTTRAGDIIEVKAGTTLYESIYARYAEALARSCPLWRIWCWKAAGFWFKRLLALPLALLGVGLTLASHTSPYAAVGSTVALGLVVNFIFHHIGLNTWSGKTPFGK